MLSSLPVVFDENMLLGYETSDDAAIYRITDDTAAVLTLDFFTPIVDDPYEFGCIAAANALSDVFAMGGKPHVALNILAAGCNLGTEVVGAIMRGGAETAAAAGCAVMGGHTIDDDEPKYGLAVFGTVNPAHIVRNEGAQPGDVVYYTKQLGTGIMYSAHQARQITDKQMHPAVETMMELNKAAAEAMLTANVHAATDVTGFGLAGHLHEMLEASNCSAQISWDALPLFDGCYEFSEALCRPAKTFDIIDWAQDFVDMASSDEDDWDAKMGVVCDPQTSGGLLVSIPAKSAATFEQAFEAACKRKPWRIGTVTDGAAGTIVVR